MNIVIPMAGLGSRFNTTHPGQIKPLIDVRGLPMIHRVINNLNQESNIKFTFITTKEIGNNKQLQNIFDTCKINFELVFVDHLTEGPACTCLLAKDIINNNVPLIIINCDQYIIDFNLKNIINFAKFNNADGVVGVFHSNSNKNSYIKLGEDLRIQEIKEKIVISNIATNGLHFWNKGIDFVTSAETMIQKDEKYSNEFYVAPSYNYMIRDGKKILPYYYNLHYPIGIPEDLKYFTNNIYEYL